MKPRYWIVVFLIVVGAIEITIWRSRSERVGEGPSVSSSLAPKELEHVRPGDIVPGFEAEDLEDGIIQVDYAPDSMTLLLFFSPTCGTCEKNLPMWGRLAEKTGGNARVLSVMVGGGYQVEQLFMNRHQLPFPVLRFRRRDTLVKYKPVTVPQTLLVGPGGKVEGVIIGPLTGEQVDRLVSRVRRSKLTPS